MKIDTYRLKPDTTFQILPEIGCNLFRWSIGSEPVLYAPEDFSTGSMRYFDGGNPILFPSVGRTWDRSEKTPVPDRYRLWGHAQKLEMPIHGIVPFGRWQKIGEDQQADQVRLDYQFSAPAAVLEKYYPFDVDFRLRYTLTANALAIEGAFENKGKIPAPFAFGVHPYFYVEDRTQIQIHLPCREKMVLDPELLIPTGLEPFTTPDLSLEADKTYDMGFSGLYENRVTLTNRSTGRIVAVDFDSQIENFVVYSAPGCKFICAEPWTKGLGGYATLNHPDWPKEQKFNVLLPGERKNVKVEFSVTA
jgi:galactose mutarotase-like enzyme